MSWQPIACPYPFHNLHKRLAYLSLSEPLSLYSRLIASGIATLALAMTSQYLSIYLSV
jgi:hypothetical protein